MTDNLYNGSRLTAHGSRLTAHEVDSVQFSIIVPVYNCEKYLIKCLDSLCNQDIFTLTNSRNYEIFIVNDGSTDKSGTICDSYAEKFSFIHVTHTENHGASHARNLALKQCKGDYIMFCDADDFVSSQLISVMTRAVELDDKADMFIFKYFNNKLPADKWPNYNISDIKISDWINITSDKLCFKVLNDDNIGGFLWNKVYKREIIQEHNFDENIRVLDDQPWVIELLCIHKNICICCINYYLYCYVRHNNFGQTRDPRMTYNKNGLSWFIIALEKELTIKNLPLLMHEQIEYAMYYWATCNYYQAGKSMTDETREKVKFLLRKYALKYYFKSGYSLWFKIKSFIRHVLITFHIYKKYK